MPNYCNNDLYVRGDHASIKLFLDSCKGATPRYKLSEGEKKFYQNDLNEVGDYSPVEVQDFTFNALVPVPEEILEVGFSGPSNRSSMGVLVGLEPAYDGYTWQIQNWGTKWDVNDPNIEFSGEQAHLWFSTAWSPPVEWVQNVAAQFPYLEFDLYYEEGGCCFAGNHTWSDGELQFEESVEGWDDYKDFCIKNELIDQEYFDEIEEMEEEE